MKNKLKELEQQIQEIEETFQWRNHQLELLRQIGIELASEHDLDVLLTSIVNRATDLANTEKCVLFMWHPEKQALQVAATTDETLIPVDWQIKSGEGMSGIVWQTGEPLVIANYDQWAKRLDVVTASINAVIVVPIRWRDQMLGVLNFVRQTNRDPFSQEDVELAKLFAAQAAVAIKNTRLLNEVQIYAHDLTMEIIERKRVEEQLRQHQNNLEELVSARTIELERSNRELRRFAYVASHDLQEPLRKIQAFGNRLESLYLNRLDAKGQHYLTRMQKAAARMQQLIQDLLLFSRIINNPIPFENVALDQVMENVLADFQQDIETINGRVQKVPLPTIEAIPFQMQQLFRNLISNAIKFRHPNRLLTIEINGRLTANHHAEITIADNGIGIEEKHQERIFVAFSKLHSRDMYEGSGIGLAICRQIVEQHKGTITFHKRSNNGTEFIMSLPIKQT